MPNTTTHRRRIPRSASMPIITPTRRQPRSSPLMSEMQRLVRTYDDLASPIAELRSLLRHAQALELHLSKLRGLLRRYDDLTSPIAELHTLLRRYDDLATPIAELRAHSEAVAHPRYPTFEELAQARGWKREAGDVVLGMEDF